MPILIDQVNQNWQRDERQSKEDEWLQERHLESARVKDIGNDL